MYRIAMTAGEPAGIGPDLCIKQVQCEYDNAQIVVMADPEMLANRAKELGVSIEIEIFTPDVPLKPVSAGRLLVLPIPLAETAQSGKLNPANSKAVLKSIELAAKGCMQNAFDAMVTAPVHKGIINAAGIKFRGHTEYLASLTETSRVVMMLSSDEMKVALATTHIPLQEVPTAITSGLLEETLTILQKDLIERFGISQPRIAVCGLNPHAGEQGHIGREEINVIEPVIRALNMKGFDLLGPVSADTAFTTANLERSDAVLAMFHDQGLAALKCRGLGEAINITLGLPILRVSVDHGVALDLAGTGLAHAGGLIHATKQTLALLDRMKHPERTS